MDKLSCNVEYDRAIADLQMYTNLSSEDKFGCIKPNESDQDELGATTDK